jgi:hypothetical protein
MFLFNFKSNGSLKGWEKKDNDGIRNTCFENRKAGGNNKYRLNFIKPLICTGEGRPIRFDAGLSLLPPLNHYKP